MIPNIDHYWLKNACVPISLLQIEDLNLANRIRERGATRQPQENVCWVDLEIKAGAIAHLNLAETTPIADELALDLQGRQVWPCFIDMHTHLDKGHIWPRSPNLDGTFANALATVAADRTQHWHAEDIYRRLEFGLKCSYAHGTQAIRTHLDCLDQQADISLEVFTALQAAWADRLTLQAVSLVSLDYFQTPAGEKLADQLAEMGGLLGGLPLMGPELETQLDRVFTLAQERGLDLDFHTDESGNPDDITLQRVAAAAIRNEFTGRVICGHCCSLAVQSSNVVRQTLDLVKQAGIGIVSLPMCNLYLQDRQLDRTPRWRGVTLLHELKGGGIPVAIASDNCRDPFYGFGDHDMLEVFMMATRIAHLDVPYSDWPRA
ncbi:MAG: cytosine deaminase, partial [Cyanothece sp. SIO1E1]|nr:cytosine deaminase [Cyanothece sp. SIO1E1]